MKLYEIDQAIENLIDPETGEIEDFEALEALQMERDRKCENVGLYIKNLDAMVKSMKAEETALKERRQTAENKIEQLKNFLLHALQERKLETARCKISFRHSVGTVIEESVFVPWAMEHRDDLLTYAKPKPSASAVKDLLKAGEEIPGAILEDRTSVTVK